MGIFQLFNHYIAKSVHNAVADIMGIHEPYDLTSDELDKIQSFIQTIETGTKAKEIKALYHGAADYSARLVGIKSVTVTDEEQKILEKLLTTENGIKFLETVIQTAKPYVLKFIVIAAVQRMQLSEEKILHISELLETHENVKSVEKILPPILGVIGRTDLSQYLGRNTRLKP